MSAAVFLALFLLNATLPAAIRAVNPPSEQPQSAAEMPEYEVVSREVHPAPHLPAGATTPDEVASSPP